MHGTAIRVGLVAAATTAALVIPGAPPAVAGGGCHEGLTQGEGDTVAMAGACFTPSVLRVDPGTEVTFLNKDPITHNVSSNGWGQFDDMNQGDAFTATFSKPGVYPFACMYHPAMVGAVVVGDGTGAGTEVTQASTGDADTTARSGAQEAAPVTSGGATGSVLGWVGGGIMGLALGTGVGLVTRRRRPKETIGEGR